MRHFLLYILLLVVFISGEAQTRRSRPQPRQSKVQTNGEARKSELTPRQIASLAFPSSVSIYVLDENEDLYGGAGFVVAPGVVITCYHVVENARRIAVTPMGNTEDMHIARLIRYDEVRDTALLTVESLKGKPLKLTGEKDFYIGETVYTLGNPKGLEGTFSNGIISNFIQVDDTFYMQFTAPVSPGSSGGPVLNSKGEVIGMVNMQFKEGQNLNFAILAVHVRLLMEGKRDLPPDTYIDNDLSSPPSRRKPN
jgi:S1-C subfamily serine protease